MCIRDSTETPDQDDRQRPLCRFAAPVARATDGGGVVRPQADRTGGRTQLVRAGDRMRHPRIEILIPARDFPVTEFPLQTSVYACIDAL